MNIGKGRKTYFTKKENEQLKEIAEQTPYSFDYISDAYYRYKYVLPRHSYLFYDHSMPLLVDYFKEMG
jgi:hypothetical protein